MAAGIIVPASLVWDSASGKCRAGSRKGGIRNEYPDFFIKAIAVFDLLVIAVYFGGDILTTVMDRFRKKPVQDDPFDFSVTDAVTVPLSIDSIRRLYSGDASDFVEEKLLPDAAQTMGVLTEREQTAARLLLSALIGFLVEEAPMDERSFPMVMELLNHMEGEKEDGCQDPVDILFEDKVPPHQPL